MRPAVFAYAGGVIRDHATLLTFIAADAALATLLAEARGRDDGDRSHDLAHALRVALWTVRLGGDRVAAREAVAAALLHDAVNPPKSGPERARASEMAAALATRRLGELGFAPAAVTRIAAAIRDHSWSRGAVPGDALGCALQDADRLEALGAIGLLRCIETGARMGAEWFDPDDPWAASRPLDDHAYSLDHFFAKLLLLPASMRTGAGRREAARRAGLLRRFVAHLGEEIGKPPPR
jgi:uncharacterized protein